MTSLPKSSSAKFARYDGATRLTSPDKVNITDKVIFKSPKNRNLKARSLQPEQSLQVSKQDCVSLVNNDLWEFLTNKRKLELLHTSPSCCEQVGYQLVIVHSVHCRLGPVLATLPVRQSVFDWLSIWAPVKHHKKGKSQNLPALPSVSINMIGRGCEPLKSRRGLRDANSPSFSSLDLDYSPGLGQVLVWEEGVFRGTRSRAAILYNYEQPSSSTGMISPELLRSSFQWSDDEGEAAGMPLHQWLTRSKRAEYRRIWPITAMMTSADSWKLKSIPPRPSKKPWKTFNKC